MVKYMNSDKREKRFFNPINGKFYDRFFVLEKDAGGDGFMARSNDGYEWDWEIGYEKNFDKFRLKLPDRLFGFSVILAGGKSLILDSEPLSSDEIEIIFSYLVDRGIDACVYPKSFGLIKKFI